MSISELLAINDQDRKKLWKIFSYEKLLDDQEELLSRELDYYESQIRSIAGTDIATEHELLQIYMNHVKNVRSLLIKLQNKRKGKLKKQLDDLKFNPAC